MLKQRYVIYLSCSSLLGLIGVQLHVVVWLSILRVQLPYKEFIVILDTIIIFMCHLWRHGGGWYWNSGVDYSFVIQAFILYTAFQCNNYV